MDRYSGGGRAQLDGCRMHVPGTIKDLPALVRRLLGGIQLLRSWSMAGRATVVQISQLRLSAAIQALVANEQPKPLPVSSSQQPPFPEKQQQLFREVLELFNRAEIPYAVSGAFALQKHTGIWRDTKDLDLFLPAEKCRKHCAACVPTASRRRSAIRSGSRRRIAGNIYVDLITGMSNAVITVDAPG